MNTLPFRTKSVAFLGFDGVEALDILGPLEALAAARLEGERAYRCEIVGVENFDFRSESGILFRASLLLDTAPSYDMIIVPGGAGIREVKTLERVAAWLRDRAGQTGRIVSVCTGIYAVAEAGLLNGRQATTHWRFASDLSARYPQIRINSDAIFVRDGDIYTSAGVTTGIDLALALIEEDIGPAAALTVARELVVYMKRPGGQAQFSHSLQFQAKAGNRFAELVAWISTHLHADLSVEALASQAGMSARNFTRSFTATFQTPPAAYVEMLRLAEAQSRLTTTHVSVSQIAASLGFNSASSFRRAFERKFEVSPTEYRRRFQTTRALPKDRINA
jgi:transcriptional regulator GlxA family with amidase domain